MASGQPAESATSSFEPFGRLQALLNGQPLSNAEMFIAEKEGTYLLLSPDLEQPLMLSSRTQKVDLLDMTRIHKNDDGTVKLLEGASTGSVGTYQVTKGQLAYSLSPGHRLTLAPKPALLNSVTADAIIAHDPSYGYRMGLYRPESRTIAALLKESRDVEVKIFFGSWCATCGRILPAMMQVEKALKGSKIRFEYVGLPSTEVDPVAEKNGIKKLPTAVVSVDGKELARRAATDLDVAEQALLEMLGGS